MNVRCRICKKQKNIGSFYYRKDSKKHRTECITCFKLLHKDFNKNYKKSDKYKKWKKKYDEKYHKESEVYKRYSKKYRKTYKAGPKSKEQQFVNNLRKYWPNLSTVDRKKKYEEMVLLYSNKCAICKKTETRSCGGKIRNLSVDHCHRTGKIRGLLCFRCNLAIGQFDDDINLLESSIFYLKEWESK